MQDREMATDLLHTQRKASADYNGYATESATPAVKSVFMDLLQSEQGITSSLFTKMSTRGWYPTEDAPEDKKCDLKAQFRGCECGCTGCQ